VKNLELRRVCHRQVWRGVDDGAMKTLLILILMVALIGGAFLSKPTQKDFGTMIRQKMAGEKKDGLLTVIFHGGRDKAEQYLQGCTFKDRGIWMDVERDGQRIYTGAFGHWFGGEGK
jgi:hypothetical protein